VDAKLFDLLGEKTAADEEKPVKKKKEKPPKVEVSFAILTFSLI
jgi:glutaminyl-tRNA synthetase